MDEGTGGEKTGGSRIIGRILPAAVRLWLRSQVEQIEQLSVELSGRDRQIIRGHLPGVEVSAEDAIYRGICVGQARVSAEDIRINIGQVVRGKPLKLLNGFPVIGEVTLTDSDLSRSLQSALLQEGLNNFWRSLLQTPEFACEVEERYGSLATHPNVTLSQIQAKLGHDSLTLAFYPTVESTTSQKLVILRTGLTVADAQFLQLNQPCWLTAVMPIANEDDGQPIQSLQDFRWNLGKDTQLSCLSIEPSRLFCSGQVNVIP